MVKSKPRISENKALEIRYSFAEAISPLVTSEQQRLNIVDTWIVEIFDVPSIPKRGDAIEKWLIKHRDRQTSPFARRVISELIDDYLEHADLGKSIDLE
jgi:hypothetical protein